MWKKKLAKRFSLVRQFSLTSFVHLKCLKIIDNFSILNFVHYFVDKCFLNWKYIASLI